MQAIDSLDGSGDAEFGSPGVGSGRSRGTCSEIGMATEKEFPRNNGPARSAIGLLNGPQVSSSPESSSKQSELRESGMLECKRHRPQRDSAMKSNDHGPAIVSDQLCHPSSADPMNRSLNAVAIRKLNFRRTGAASRANRQLGTLIRRIRSSKEPK